MDCLWKIAGKNDCLWTVYGLFMVLFVPLTLQSIWLEMEAPPRGNWVVDQIASKCLWS